MGNIVVADHRLCLYMFDQYIEQDWAEVLSYNYTTNTLGLATLPLVLRVSLCLYVLWYDTITDLWRETAVLGVFLQNSSRPRHLESDEVLCRYTWGILYI